MTDLIERVDAAFSEGVDEAPEGAHPDGPIGPERVDGGGTTRPLQIVAAVAAAGSAVLLFSMASAHLHGGWATMGVVAALVQVAIALGVMSRPTRALFVAAVVANAAIGALWAGTTSHGVSWATAGIGIGLSALVLVLAALLGWRPALGSTWSSGTSVIGSLVPLAVVAVTIGALFATGTPVPGGPSSAVKGGAGGAASGVNAATALAEAGSVKVPGEDSKTFASTLAGNKTEQAENAKYVPLDPHDQAILSQQLAQAYQAAMEFPTVASAKAAGMILAGGMAPGVGAHYQMITGNAFKGVNADGTINAQYPASWIYASAADDAPVVGIMYESFGQSAPSGFVGPNDHWHRHSDVCVQIEPGKIVVPFAADQDVSPQECADAHGQFMKKTVWMVHAWVVPGWESPQGVFSHDNLHVYCPGNTDLTNAIGFCNRQS